MEPVKREAPTTRMEPVKLAPAAALPARVEVTPAVLPADEAVTGELPRARLHPHLTPIEDSAPPIVVPPSATRASAPSEAAVEEVEADDDVEVEEVEAQPATPTPTPAPAPVAEVAEARGRRRHRHAHREALGGDGGQRPRRGGASRARWSCRRRRSCRGEARGARCGRGCSRSRRREPSRSWAPRRGCW
ncbi:MAG: hypothetical protein R3A52_24750 [Polyangiales bacterium]